MFTSRVTPSLVLPSRLDTDYYHPDAIDSLRQIRSHPHQELRDLGKVWCFGAYELCNFIEESPNFEDPVFITISDMKTPFVDLKTCQRVTEQTHQILSAAHVAASDVLVSIAGSIGVIAIVPDLPELKASANQAIAKFRSNEIDAYYLTAFLSSDSAQKVIMREAGGAVQKNLYLYNFERISVLVPHGACQKYIGNKVRQAERLRVLGNKTMHKARSVIELVNDGQLLAGELEEEKFSWDASIDRIASPHSQIDAKHDRVKPKLLSDRIDSWFYKPEFVRGDSQLQIIRQTGIETPPLHSFASVSYGFMPTEDYWSKTEGALFLRVTNIQDNLRLDLTKLEYVNPHLSKASRYRLEEDDIVCVQCGNSTGRIALISSRCKDWVFPSFALRIRLNDKDWDAAYVAGYLASWLGQSQIQRTISITSVRPNTTKPAIEAVTVPKIPLRTQKIIGEKLRIAINCIEQSVPLCNAARLIVEALIERNITEGELSNAQTMLEKGDDSADRAILSRLYEGGWDATETRPLFPDLDAYYEILRMVEREQAEVAPK